MRIGIDIGGTKISAVSIGSDGTPLEWVRTDTPYDAYDDTLATVCNLVRRLEMKFPQKACVGVGTPGAISPNTGRLKNANATWLIGRPVFADLAGRLERPLRLANDADCFALSEAVDGAGAGESPVFGVILGTGVGGGLVVEGRSLSGRNAIAGEWGHNPLPRMTPAETPGPSCYCGRRGCIETFLSGPALAADYAAHGGEAGTPAQDVARRAAAGDAAANAALDRYIDRLGRALGSVINIVDPAVVVLGGGLSNIARLYRDLPASLAPHVFTDRLLTEIRPPRHGDDSGVLGAARLWSAVEAAGYAAGDTRDIFEEPPRDA
jgi:fructokinase